jgi:hypothetical protein
MVHLRSRAGQDLPARGVVSDREQNVLGGEVRMTAILGALGGDHQDAFESGSEHDGLCCNSGGAGQKVDAACLQAFAGAFI